LRGEPQPVTTWNAHEEVTNLAFTLAPLLIHSSAVPSAARDALKRAQSAPPDDREAWLESAAGVLYRETDLECSEVRDLIGLSPDGNCL
jgi:hypothetical protein